MGDIEGRKQCKLILTARGKSLSVNLRAIAHKSLSNPILKSVCKQRGLTHLVS